MCAAIQSVEDGSSISQAAHAHGVPYTILYDRIVGSYDLPDPVYQQWLKINHLTAEVQNELQGLPNEVINSSNEVVGDQEDACKKQSDKPDSLTLVAVNQEGQVASSTQFDISPEQEQLFERTYEDPCFMQWLKRGFHRNIQV